MGKKNVEKRHPDAVVISDTHLATLGCKADQLHAYLKSIRPGILILNGDIIDAWRFSRNYFPASHMKVARQVIKMMESGTQVIYITGNHDEILRRFTDICFERFSIANKAVLTLDGHKTWIFHGDVFDVVMQHSKWLAKLGSAGYGLLTLINKLVNSTLRLFGGKRISLAKKIKDKVKGGSDKEVSNFEKTVADLAINKSYKYVICGHIHRPAHKIVTSDKGQVTYLNSGDWVDNMTALEYENGDWHLKYWDQETDVAVEDANVETMFTTSEDDIFRNTQQEVIQS
jgi:UDP-2,3-diacylglucosamine pyrophosphatase LpxH